MDTIGAIANSVTAAIAIVAAVIALMQFHYGRRDAMAARTAELSWNIYLAYGSDEIRRGRRALNQISRSEPIPLTALEFGQMYFTHTFSGPDADAIRKRADGVVSGRLVRSILRYYHQVGILLEKRLIDADFVFPLMGDGLESSATGIRLSTEWYQTFYGGETGRDEAPRRTIYENAPKLIEQYHSWRAAHDQSG